ncbi:uncharacterized protein DUF3291 [Isoptericola sp. CG 20/1183]|uniref:Uncharacterized protein DUF3291 n=1 Tax=Isoptericola halotolerans TaxID=300560 RepID=A0ABX5EB29_9MICO|nr:MULTISPECIES: DUF3291 domain-containing protein [Isoptericola]PRZ04478.1 uncharacterized protein DUF3291 [Isoptericola halotolerans]PRZ04624.1 uncharacterized protein DUF3291 [Isoptericola sp. CG 20/1183]
MASFELAQVNVARLLAPLDSAELADFVDLLAPVNQLAETSPGYLWRLQSDGGDATDIEGFRFDVDDSPGVIVNMSVWRDVASLSGFVYGGLHRQVLRRRREWFSRMTEAYTACWWVPAGHRPTVAEAEERVLHLRAHGPSSWAFTLQQAFDATGAPAASDGVPDAVSDVDRASRPA